MNSAPRFTNPLPASQHLRAPERGAASLLRSSLSLDTASLSETTWRPGARARGHSDPLADSDPRSGPGPTAQRGARELEKTKVRTEIRRLFKHQSDSARFCRHCYSGVSRQPQAIAPAPWDTRGSSASARGTAPQPPSCLASRCWAT